MVTTIYFSTTQTNSSNFSDLIWNANFDFLWTCNPLDNDDDDNDDDYEGGDDDDDNNNDNNDHCDHNDDDDNDEDANDRHGDDDNGDGGGDDDDNDMIIENQENIKTNNYLQIFWHSCPLLLKLLSDHPDRHSF